MGTGILLRNTKVDGCRFFISMLSATRRLTVEKKNTFHAVGMHTHSFCLRLSFYSFSDSNYSKILWIQYISVSICPKILSVGFPIIRTKGFRLYSAKKKVLTLFIYSFISSSLSEMDPARMIMGLQDLVMVSAVYDWLQNEP